MLYIIAIVLGVALGILKGGSISNLLDIKLERTWLIFMGFSAMIVSQAAGTRLSFIPGYTLLIQGIVFGFILAGFWVNRRYRGIPVIGLGCFLNAVVIMANGGRMPVGYEAVAAANLSAAALKGDIKHIVVNISEGTRLAFLADVINLPYFFGYLMRIVSIGDLIVAVGLLIFVWQTVAAKKTDC